MPPRPKQQDKEQEAYRYRLRHSASHVMADAVQHLFPDAKLGIGPPIEDGFYYDFEVPRPFTPEDMEQIEARMRETIDVDYPFVRRELDRGAARELFALQPYKQELINDVPPEEPLSTYEHGSFVDLCEGPHVESTGQIPAFKLLHVAGAYWRGDEKRPMLQRIYGTAWESPQALDEHLCRLEEAQRRDHRKLGRELDLFSVHEETGPGLIIWHPKGAKVRTIIEDHWRALHERRGYQLVYTPHIGRSHLWNASGHLEFYQDSMYASIDVENQQYYLRPMNCPFHILIYKSTKRSYRELPLRYAELGTVYRYERTGVLHGLLRVRGFTQDDAHIFCRPDQVEDEVLGVLNLTFELLETYGFADYEISLSTRPEKFVGEPAAWDHATASLRHALESRAIDYEMDEGGGAFYGPKIDVKIRDSLGRAWQCTTVQFDFNLPERFQLIYVGADGREDRPYMVHRAILGSLERFLGVLIEHYGGAFPMWLAPIQATIIPIADRHHDYARQVAQRLEEAGIRVHLDARNERMNLKIREAQLQKVPYMLVVGDREAQAGTVALRMRSGDNPGPVPVEEVLERLREDIAARR